jgi:hypothetical protein
MLPPRLNLPRQRTPITYSKVLVVEGNDAFQFFKALLQRLDLLDSIEIRNLGGVTDWNDSLRALAETSGFPEVKSLGIIRDAEEDADAAFRSVCSGLRQNSLATPRRPNAVENGVPSVSIFILPDCVNAGMLESLCMQAVSASPVMPCVDGFFDCMQLNGMALPKNMHKARTHVFLASRPKSDLLLGEAAHAGYFPWDNPAFDQLKAFLRSL